MLSMYFVKTDLFIPLNLYAGEVEKLLITSCDLSLIQIINRSGGYSSLSMTSSFRNRGTIWDYKQNCDFNKLLKT